MKKYFVYILTLALALPLMFSSIQTPTGAYASSITIDEKELESAIIKLLNEKPEILFQVFENNSLEFIESITQSSENARSKKLHQDWQTDLQTKKAIELTNRPLLGNVTAKNTIIGYSDFLCSFCSQAATTVEGLIKKRNDIKFIFKGVPTNDASRTAMKWFYLLNEKDSKKAWQLHDSIFANQKAFAQNHMSVIHELAKQLGYNPIDLERELLTKNKDLDALINNDIKELESMKLSGTPNFVVNNLILRGAYPANVFEEAITFSEENK